MFKPPKIDKEQFQIEVEQSEYRGFKQLYTANELQVYGNQIHDTTKVIKARRIKRSNSMHLETLNFYEG